MLPRRSRSFSWQQTIQSSSVLSQPRPAWWQPDRGVNILANELVAKRLALLRELLPAVARVAVLVDPANKTVTEPTLQGVESAAMALQIQVLNASNGREIGAAFAAIEHERPDALFVSIGTLFTARR